MKLIQLITLSFIFTSYQALTKEIKTIQDIESIVSQKSEEIRTLIMNNPEAAQLVHQIKKLELELNEKMPEYKQAVENLKKADLLRCDKNIQDESKKSLEKLNQEISDLESQITIENKKELNELEEIDKKLDQLRKNLSMAQIETQKKHYHNEIKKLNRKQQELLKKLDRKPINKLYSEKMEQKMNFTSEFGKSFDNYMKILDKQEYKNFQKPIHELRLKLLKIIQEFGIEEKIKERQKAIHDLIQYLSQEERCKWYSQFGGKLISPIGVVFE